MGDHAYAYKGQSAYGDDEKVCRTYVYDVDGRQRTVIGCPPYYDTDSYIVETEVTERVRSPAVITTDYHRHGSSSPPKKTADYGSYGSYDRYRRPSSPSYYDRRAADAFVNRVQIEASRPNNSTNRYTPPQNVALGRPTVHKTTGYGGGYGDYRTGNNYGGYSSSDDDDGEDTYYRPKPSMNAIRPEPDIPIRPSPKTYATEDRWSSAPPPANQGVGKLGMPTNSIDQAVDYLRVGRTEPVKTYGSNLKTTESGKPYGAYGSDFKSTEAAKAYGTKNPIGSTGATAQQVIDCYEAARKYNGKVIRS